MLVSVIRQPILDMALDKNMTACIMKMAPMYTTVRVNTLKMNMQTAKEKMTELLEIVAIFFITFQFSLEQIFATFQQYKTKGCNNQSPVVEIHSRIPDLLVVKAIGPNFEVKPVETEIYVDEACASAVMRGADIFSCGVLGSNKS